MAGEKNRHRPEALAQEIDPSAQTIHSWAA
jgi:hypothetical protein